MVEDDTLLELNQSIRAITGSKVPPKTSGHIQNILKARLKRNIENDKLLKIGEPQIQNLIQVTTDTILSSNINVPTNITAGVSNLQLLAYEELDNIIRLQKLVTKSSKAIILLKTYLKGRTLDPSILQKLVRIETTVSYMSLVQALQSIRNVANINHMMVEKHAIRMSPLEIFIYN